MKLLFAIVQNDDQKSLTYALIEQNISVTRIASTGGFLRGGNSTLMIGVEPERLDETLSIINELRSRSVMKTMRRFELDVLYARAKAKLWSKVERLRAFPDIKIADFGTRRRHSHLWQDWCVNALKEKRKPDFRKYAK